MQATTAEPRTREAEEKVDGRTFAVIPAWVMRDPRCMAQLNGSGWAVLAVLALHRDAVTGVSWPSLRTIGAYLGHTSAAQRGMAQLIELGIVTVYRRGGGKGSSGYKFAATPPDRTAGSAPVDGCATASKRTAGEVRQVGPDESGAPTHGCAGEAVAHPIPAVAHPSEARSAPAREYRTENREQAAAEQTAAAALALEELDPADVAWVRAECNGSADSLLEGLVREHLAYLVSETLANATTNPGGYFASLRKHRKWPPTAVAPRPASSSIETEKRTPGVDASEEQLKTLEAAGKSIAAEADETEAFLAQFRDEELEAIRQQIAAEANSSLERASLLRQDLRRHRVAGLIAQRIRESDASALLGASA